MRYLTSFTVALLITMQSFSQEKTENIERAFFQDMRKVNTKFKSLGLDTQQKVSFYKPVRNKKDYQFELYRVEDQNTPAGARRLVMAAEHVLVTLRPGADVNDIQTVFADSLIDKPERIPNTDTYIVPIKGQAGIDAVESLKSSPARNLGAKSRFDSSVKSIDYDYVVFAQVIPDDPDFPKLWGLHNTGQTGGTVDADIDAVEAWDVTRGDDTLVVGVIDSGIDYKHRDLATNIWINEIEKNGRRNVDDDGNGYVDDIHGWNFFSRNNNPHDDNGHGTHVAGTIGAIGGNKEGVAGVSGRVKMVPLKFLSANGSGSLSGAIAAIAYASTIRNMIATNNSWGGGDYSQNLKDVIDKAAAKGILFIAAASNDSQNNDEVDTYPADYECVNIISVAATDKNDKLADFSNYGATSVHIAAPGVGIYSTLPNNKYGTLSGTSMATPHVTGVCVLVKAQFPNLTMLQVKGRILSNADRKASLTNKISTGARLNAHTAVLGQLQ